MNIDKTPFTLRITSNIYEKIRIIAFINRRSMNSQIETFLEQCIKDYESQHGSIRIQEEK